MIKKKVDKTCTQYWKKDWKYVSMAGTPNFGHLSASILILKNLAHDKIFLFKFLTISKCVLGLDSCSWMIYGCPQCTWRVTWALFHPNFLSDVGMEHHVTFSCSVSLLGNVVWFMACQGCCDSSLPRSNASVSWQTRQWPATIGRPNGDGRPKETSPFTSTSFSFFPFSSIPLWLRLQEDRVQLWCTSV